MAQEYDEKHEADLRKRAESGRKAEVVKEYLKKFILHKRARLIGQLETSDFASMEDILKPVIYLRVLSELENDIEATIYIGQKAEEELSNGGE